MNISEYKDFINVSSPEDDDPAQRLNLSLKIPYLPHLHSAGTKGFSQCMDRVQFMVENWHSAICSHPTLRNPDPEFDRHRELVANISHNIFVLYSMLNEYEIKEERPFNSVQ